MRGLVVVVALLAFGAVALFVAQTFPPRIEADLQRRAADALATANLQFAKVDVKGRAVTLSGEAPGPTAKEDAVKIASNVWGVESVTDMLSLSSASQPVSPLTAIEPKAVTTEPAPAAVAPASEPAAPPPVAAEEAAPALPTVAGVIDPALVQPSEPNLAPEPPPPAAEQLAAPAPQETQTTAAQIPASPAPVLTEAPAPAPALPTAAPPAPSMAPVAPALPSSPAPQPSTHPAVAPSQAALAQGVTAGLTTSIQNAAPAAVAAPSYRLEAHIEGRRVELQGLVSTPSAERALVAHVRSHFWRAQVVDSLKVAHTAPDKDWLDVARKGLSQLAHLDTGSLKLDGQVVTVSGRPRSDADRGRVLAALNELPHGYTSTVLLERRRDPATPPALPAPTVVAAAPVPIAVPPKRAPSVSQHARARYRAVPPRQAPLTHVLSTECRWRFGDVLPRVAVVFESGSSRVLPSAVAGLDELARVARACPYVRLRLTGHSDTHEAPATETSLSRQRALAVREALEARGISGSSISVAGRGGLRPVFSNATADGRENNRRVEFAVW